MRLRIKLRSGVKRERKSNKSDENKTPREQKLVANCARRMENAGQTKAGRINNESRYREFSSWLFITKIGLAVMEVQLHLQLARHLMSLPFLPFRNRSEFEITSCHASKDNRWEQRGFVSGDFRYLHCWTKSDDFFSRVMRKKWSS